MSSLIVGQSVSQSVNRSQALETKCSRESSDLVSVSIQGPLLPAGAHVIDVIPAVICVWYVMFLAWKRCRSIQSAEDT